MNDKIKNLITLLLPILLIFFFSCEKKIISIHSISGRIERCGQPLPGVQMLVIHERHGAKMIESNEKGEYVFTDMWEGAYEIIPMLDKHTFDPPAKKIVVNKADILHTNFSTMTTWKKSFAGDANGMAYSIKQTSDCGCIVAGNKDVSNGLGKVNHDVWLMKLNILGEVEWEKTFGGDEFDGAKVVRETDDGGFIVAAETFSKGGEASDVWLLKLNPDGELTWKENKYYGGNRSDNVKSLEITSEGGYVFSGFTNSYGTDFCDFWVVKVDPLGNVEDNKTFSWARTGGEYTYEKGNSVYESVEGNGNRYYLVAGNREYGLESDGMILKLLTNDFSSEVWAQYYRAEGGGSKNQINQLVQTNDGGYVTIGTTNLSGADLTDMWIMKLNQDSTIQWEKIIDGTSTDRGFSISQTSDNGYIIAGSSWRKNSSKDDFCLIKLDSKGEIEWEKTYDGNDGSIDEVRSVEQTYDGGYIFVGNTQSYAGKDSITIMKLDNNGEILE